ncbi:Inositol-phosphate phosphatase [Parvibaculum lavamentivorans DS-1]|uniref:Inositol-phosphate phosphatase n=1 Tax=Parvibaculum lavamentivorans (strain DS-1 / DSM 13023 / NCIMB 13966) TaxID=402881 RepID=A7HQS0_PARL1|nr:3'(2'),5'-bisphosphate nucleotidase CysQ [Parvibaculum lavamentivorans]ABS62253.1 Inositol-phosphate phosphatase [Parvibaculum lavamentivorans DS-1]
MPEPEARTADFTLLKDVVREAGALAMRYYQTDLRKWSKAHDDTPVTEADIAVNDLLRSRLMGARPDYGWLSEETEDDDSRLSRPFVWVVDPIDGTRAFAKGKPHFAISAALVAEGRPLLAALFNPATGEFFEAALREGARLNGEPIRVSDCREIEGCRMVAFAPMFKHPAWPDAWPEMDISDRNSVAYRIALVASGQADATLALNGKNDWDLAAADLILHEAGGRMTTHDGTQLLYNRPTTRHPSLLAAGPALYDALFARVGAVKLRS